MPSSWTALTRARTYPGRPADVPSLALIGRVVDNWPADGALPPLVALLRSVAAEDPKQLFETMQRERFRPLQAQAPNTQKAYASDWRVFVRFCQAAGISPLPASPAALEAFVEWSLPYSAEVPYQYVLPESRRRNVKVSTVERALVAIGVVHRWLKYPDPSAHEDVRHTLKINARGRSNKTPKAPLPYTVVEKALPTYGTSLRDLRAKAVATLVWPSYARRSELVAIEVEDLQFAPDKEDGLVRLRRSKSDQAGKGDLGYVSAEARTHLEAWLRAAGITRGPVFRGLNRLGELRRPAPGTLPKPLHANEVAHTLKDVARRAGYAKAEVARISGHSPRIGATHSLLEAGYSSGQIQLSARWKSERMVTLYGREIQVREGAMARFFARRAAAGSSR
jgi:integrase